MKKIIKMLVYIFLGLLLLLVLTATLYLNFSPQVGGRSQKFDSPNFQNGKFVNLVETPMTTGDKSMWASVWEFFFARNKDSFPGDIIQTLPVDQVRMSALGKDQVAVAWLGHSTALIKFGETTLITDPVLNGKSIPPMHMGPRPFPYSNTYDVNNLPQIDAVLISHDHFDHLDMETVKELRESQFFVPLGLKAHLLKWGVEEKNVTELDWYEEKDYSDNIKLTLTPARHFSGRGLFNRGSTLWGSFVIELGGRKIFFSGDSGYFEEFKKIGKEFGPFDLALLDAGQYDKSWQSVHMLPEEVVQAGQDLDARAILPIHNSKYVLALHAWYDPLEEVVLSAEQKNVTVTTPQIGETILLGDSLPRIKWWKR